MVLLERRIKTGENEWLSLVVVVAACMMVPLLEGDVKWLVIGMVSVPVVIFEIFRQKVREPLMGIWGGAVYFYRQGKLVATIPLKNISDFSVMNSGFRTEKIVFHLVDDKEFLFDVSHCRRPLRRALVRCLHKHVDSLPGLSLEQAL